MRKLLIALTLLVGAPAWAVPTEWSPQNTLGAGSDKVVTWTEATSDDSGVLVVAGTAQCSNTGAEDFTVYVSDRSGNKLHKWWGPVINGGDCDPATAADTCGSVELLAGYYVFDPDTGNGASALCKGVGSHP
jgi:hypothetical protein